MKIICMDCQTESHVDPETVKGKKHIECDHCAADFRANSSSEVAAAPLELTANVDAVFNSDSIPEQLPEGDIQWLDDENVLDISVVPFAPSYPELTKADELISLVPDETKDAPSIEEASVPHSELAPAIHPSESSVQRQREPDSVVEPSTPVALAETHLPEAGAVSLSGKSEKVKLLAFSTTKLMTIAATFVLFISVASVINSPVSKVDSKAQSPAPPPVNSAEKKVEQKPAVATSVLATETSIPTPSASPATAQENVTSTAATTPAANQPVNEPKASQPALSEPAATDDGRISVQVGSHNQMGLAEGQAEKLRAAGYEPRVVSVEIPKRGRWYRVQVGNFSDRQEAQQFGAQLVSKGVVESFVIADK